MDTSVYLWEELPCGQSIQGPAIIIDKNRQAFSLSTAITLSVQLCGSMPRLHKSNMAETVYFEHFCCSYRLC